MLACRPVKVAQKSEHSSGKAHSHWNSDATSNTPSIFNHIQPVGTRFEHHAMGLRSKHYSGRLADQGHHHDRALPARRSGRPGGAPGG